MDDKHQSIIEQSWQRCRQSGLSHSSNPTVELETGYLFNQALDEHSGLIKTTHHKVLPFYDSLLANSNSLHVSQLFAGASYSMNKQTMILCPSPA